MTAVGYADWVAHYPIHSCIVDIMGIINMNCYIKVYFILYVFPLIIHGIIICYMDVLKVLWAMTVYENIVLHGI